jgi:serine/threonine protein kinase
MFCPKCRTENPDHISYCSACGSDLSSRPSSHSSAVARPSPGPRRSASSGGTSGGSASGGAAESESDLAPGTVVAGRYRIDRLIGRGGMGSVYLAVDQLINRRVAVKFIRSKLLGSGSAYRRFIQEANVCLDLAAHPNIVSVFNVAEWEGRACLVMELLKGASLHEEIRSAKRQGRALSFPYVAEVLRQTLAALVYAHANGVVHRDLKPANIMLAEEADGRRRAVVMDFGLAKAGRSAAGQTRGGTRLGTPRYMAPEQRLGAEKVDGRADIYSLGVVAYEALAGGLPARKEGPLPPLKRGDLPDGLDDWLQRAVQLDPDRRFPSAKAMAEALEEIEAAPAGPVSEEDALLLGFDDGPETSWPTPVAYPTAPQAPSPGSLPGQSHAPPPAPAQGSKAGVVALIALAILVPLLFLARSLFRESPVPETTVAKARDSDTAFPGSPSPTPEEVLPVPPKELPTFTPTPTPTPTPTALDIPDDSAAVAFPDGGGGESDHPREARVEDGATRFRGDLGGTSHYPTASLVQPAGQFTKVSWPSIRADRPVCAGDVDGDGFPDVVVVQKDTLAVYDRDGYPMWQRNVIADGGISVYRGRAAAVSNVELVDFTGDGAFEIVLIAGSRGLSGPPQRKPMRLLVYNGADGAVLRSHKILDGAPGLGPNKCFDINGDGKTDVVAAIQSRGHPYGLFVYDWDKGGLLLDEPVAASPAIAGVGDVDGDGAPEILLIQARAGGDETSVGDYDARHCYAMLLDASGKRLWRRSFEGFLVGSLADVTGDGRLDPILLNEDQYGATLYRLDAAKGVAVASRGGFKSGGGALWTVADVTGDGAKEFVWGDGDSLHVVRLAGLDMKRLARLQGASRALASNDLNGDGRVEIIARQRNRLIVYDGDLQEIASCDASGEPQQAAVIDLDLDGVNEILLRVKSRDEESGHLEIMHFNRGGSAAARYRR